MAYTRSADGIATKGEHDVNNLGDSGPKAKLQEGGKKGAGVTGMEMRKVGRNLARANYQKRG